MSDEDSQEPVADQGRRAFLGASALGLAGLAGAGASTATAETEYAVEQHDHSGKYGTATSLGKSSPVESIRVGDLRTRRKPVVDVRAYGAEGDGETDDHAAIQAAFDAAGDGDAVFFPPGTYLSSGPLTASGKGLTLRGAGAGVSTVRFTGSERGVRISFSTDAGRTLNVEDLSLDTTGSGGTALSASWSGEQASERTTATIERLEVKGDWETGVALENARNAAIDTVRGEGVDTGTVIDLRGDCSDTVARNVGIYYYGTGVDVSSESEGVHVTDSTFVAVDEGVVARGAKISVQSTHVNSRVSGVRLEGVDDGYVAGNLIYKFNSSRPYDGVLARDSSAVQVANNQVYSLSTADVVNRAVAFENCEQCTAIGNLANLIDDTDHGVEIVDSSLVTATENLAVNPADAVRIGAGSEGCVVASNILESSSSDGAVTDAGSQNLVRHNLDYQPST